MSGVNLDLMKRELEDSLRKEEERKLRGAETLKFTVGNTPIRMLPPIDGSGKPWIEMWQHFGFLKNRKRPLTCPKTFDENQACPLCEYVDMLYKRKTEEDRKEAKAKRAQFSCEARALKLDANGGNDGNVYKIFFKATLKKKFQSWFSNPWYQDFTDENEGRDIIIKRVGEGQLDTEYDAEISPNKTPIKGWEQIKQKMGKLSEAFEVLRKNLLPYEKLNGILHGTYELEDDKEETQAPAAPKSTDPMTAAKAELEALKNKKD